MIFLALGGNLPFGRLSSPMRTLEVVLEALAGEEVEVAIRSRWYHTAPVAEEPQPWYTNAVVELKTELAPEPLMARLLALEARFGRIRSQRNAPRTVDLDLLAYHDRVIAGGEPEVVLPHPRLHERAFVLRPLVDIAPNWCHPVLQRTARELLESLPPGQVVLPVD